MRIAQIVLPGASEYERKSQRADREALAAKHEVLVVTPEEARTSGADVAHVYASGELPAGPFVRFPIPYVASAAMKQSRWSLRRPTPPVQVPELPEVVEERYFGASHEDVPRDVKVVGSFARKATHEAVLQARARIDRFRSDVTWRLVDRVPSPEDLASVDVWVDPAVAETDWDGFVAEALVVDTPVVATRIAVNQQRLEQGRTGMLVPPRDPNEMTHAILAVLFKREVAEGRQNAARQTVSKFRARQRLRILVSLYETLIR